MSVKQKILEIFEIEKGRYISGEELAAHLSVSRTAIWKAVKSLQGEGYSIAAVPNKGYCLSNDTDILSAQSISKYLSGNEARFEISVYKTIDSTNIRLKELAGQGAPEGTVVIAEEQTSGKGRMHRSFYSPAASGIYMSILLRPKLTAAEALFLTTSAAVAVAQAIETVSGREAKIKWVNDIYCGGKKICGILTEAAFDMESGGLEYAVLGIGINVKTPKDGFPDDIKDIAAAVFENDLNVVDTKSRLAAEVMKRFWHYYMGLENKTFLNEYRERSLVIGKEIMVIGNNTSEKAFALEIDDQCQLKVRLEDGTIKLLSSGEVSIKVSK
jgi:BirA family biotin operon repressor/biotin-[acetyl-CoA-carboxylase] ligase